MNAKFQRVFIAMVLLAAVAFVYLSARDCGFVIIADSEHPGNAGIISGLSWTTIKWSFTHIVAGNWYPLTMVTHAMDRQFFGANPGGHHLTNVALHMANTVLLFGLLLQLLPVPRGWKSNLWPAAMIAALFGLHPLRVESVAWVAERKDVLSGLFFMLTLWAYVRYGKKAPNSKAQAPEKLQAPNLEGPDAAGITNSEGQVSAPINDSPSRPWKWYIIALVLFVLGLLAKPMLVTLPFLLLLLDLWPLNRIGNDTKASVRSLVLEKVPFFALSGIFSVITYFAQKKDSLVIDFATLPLAPRIANAFVSYARYLSKTVWPVSLSAYYPMQKWQTPQVLLAAFLVIAISVFALLMVRRRPWVFVGWFWFAGLLFPVIGISQVAMQAMADRYTYLPHIGLFILVVWAVCQLPVQRAKMALSVLGVAALSFGAVSAHQLRYWKDSETLFRHIIAVTPDNDITKYFMGLTLLEKRDLDAAQYYFEGALKMNAKYSGAYMRLGDILAARNRLEEAEQNYRAAVNAEPKATICHLRLAKFLAKRGIKDEAIEHYRFALKNRPEIADAQYQLGQLLNERHDVAGAIVAFDQAVRVKPDLVDALNDLAWALATQPDAKLRDGARAVEIATRAAELTHRNSPGILDTLAAAYAEAGRFEEASATIRDAIQKAQSAGAIGLPEEFQTRLKLYQAKQPYREL
jgi:tetratricopeptide (TPR) repeat protein